MSKEHVKPLELWVNLYPNGVITGHASEHFSRACAPIACEAGTEIAVHVMEVKKTNYWDSYCDNCVEK